jgi:L-alanine-DL-glutamate epimerase-like enolase superfamily enzyme
MTGARATRPSIDLGEIRTPEAMAELAYQFHQKYGFRVSKLKGGVLAPDAELETLRQIARASRQGSSPPHRSQLHLERRNRG